MLCKEFKVLPGPGGLLDQDGKLVWMLKLVSSAVAEKQELDMKQNQAKMRTR